MTIKAASRRRRHTEYDWLGLRRIWLAAAAAPVTIKNVFTERIFLFLSR